MQDKNSAASEQTKQQLAAALKTLMERKPLDKITISELTALCKIRRQSFYYHFEDIFDLVRWMFENEAISLLKQQEGALLWKEGLLGQIERTPEQLIEFADVFLNDQVTGAAARA